MPKVLKYLLIAISALVIVMLIIVAVVAATFNPNDYKPLIIKAVKEKTQRTLTIPGKIGLTFFPRIGADLGQVVISERNGSAEFASVNSAKVSVALIPLLSKRLVVDRVVIDGFHADIKRYKDGSTNFDDLTSKEKSGSQPAGGQVDFNIGGIVVTDSSVLFDDRQQDRRIEISDLNLDTGRIADGTKSDFKLHAHIVDNKPAVNATVDADSDFLFELAQKHYVLDGLNAEVKGRVAGFDAADFQLKGNADLRPDAMRFTLDGIELAASGKQGGQSFDLHCEVPKLAVTDKAVSGGKVSGKAKLAGDGRNVSADFSMASFDGSPQAFRIAALTVDATIKEAQLDAKAKIAGAVTGNIDKLLFTLPQLNITLDGKQNGSAFKLAANGQASADLTKHTASSALNGSIDESHFDAKLGLIGFSPAAYTFNIGIDRIDADRYLKKSAAAPTAKSPPANAPEQPMDLSALKTLNATGSMRIGALKVENIKASNVRFDLHAAAGKLDIRPLTADLYGGSAAGGMSVDASAQPRFGIQQKLVNIQVGNLLKDAIGKAQIDGKGNVQLDVHAQGNVFSRIKKTLDGTAKLDLRDGAVYGINIAKTIRDAKTKLSALRGGEAPQAGTSSKEEKTDFSEMSASFRIANGVAHNDDLSVKSPLLRLGGSGDVDIGEDRIDYLVKATVVSSLQGQGGPELQALKGLTVPVKLYGPFDAIGWKVDFGSIVSGAAKQKIEQKKAEVTQKAKQKIQEELGNKLKGLFGK